MKQYRTSSTGQVQFYNANGSHYAFLGIVENMQQGVFLLTRVYFLLVSVMHSHVFKTTAYTSLHRYIESGVKL